MLVFEALNALYGDCLIVRYLDKEDNERLWIIDGGPRAAKVNGETISVWNHVLLPRLKQINSVRPLSVDLGMVSHIDDDHINGMERLTADLIAAQPHLQDVKFKRFWFNSFDEIVGPLPAGVRPASSGAVPAELIDATSGMLALDGLDHDGEAILQSVGQGMQLATNLRSLSLAGNTPFNGLISAKKEQNALLLDDAAITVLGPVQNRLDRLRTDWLKALSKPSKPARVAALQKLFASNSQLDSSVPNLSSIVVLVEINGKTMLLTGDARGDDIVSAWTELGLPDERRTIDLLKMPHHGSFANSPENFLRFFEASHYVFSADGKHENPDPPVLEGLVSIHGDRPITLHFTNADIKWKKPYRLERGEGKVQTLKEMLQALKGAYPGPWQFNVRDPSSFSVEVQL